MSDAKQPTTIPIHPMDILTGTMLPDVQSYYLCQPTLPVDLATLRSYGELLIRERFQRLGYRAIRSAGTWSRLEPAEDIAAPVTLLSIEELLALDVTELEAAPGDRLWHLYVATSPEITVLIGQGSHFMGQGDMMAGCLVALSAFMRGTGEPPQLSPEQEAAFTTFQQNITERFQARAASWAEYHRLSFPATRIKALSQALGHSFTDTTMLWLARTIQDVAERPRNLRILAFKMDMMGGSQEISADTYGNRGLEILPYEMRPDGRWSYHGKPRAERLAWEDSFVRFYRRFPLKRLLNWAIARRVRKMVSHGKKDRDDQMVINNLGSTDYPTFRTMFFNPASRGTDRFGLVFVDGHMGQVMLQFATPKRYLEHFDWSTFEQRLSENLDAMLTEPRIAESRDDTRTGL